jgi:glucan biosynthesis protein C
MTYAVPQTPLHWSQQRRYALDWLRVLAFGLLILYHLGMAYVADWGWHIKSLYQSELLQYPMLWSNQWRMSLLFLISGAAVSYQLHRYSGWGFITATMRKLLIPLAFGSLVIVAPQAFVESKTAGAIPEMHYLEFWRHYLGYPFGFGEPLPPAYTRFAGANAIWNHLWYLPYLFVYMLLVWLMYPCFRHTASTRVMKKLGDQMSFGQRPLVALYLIPILLFFGIGEWLWERFPTTHKLVDDWYNHLRYFSVFLIGFGLVRSERLWQSLGALRRLSIVLAICSYAAIVFYVRGGELSSYLPLLAPIEGLLRGFIWSANSWLWIMAILGYAQTWLNRPSAPVRYANSAVYCWYILHQTLIVVGVYLLQPYQLGPLVEPLLVVILTGAGCLFVYEVVKHLPTPLQAMFGVFISSRGSRFALKDRPVIPTS